MNPEIFNDPKKFLWPFVQARQAQKQLENKLVDVEKDFAMKQAFLGWIVDNPWIFAFLLNREVERIEGNSCAEAKQRVVELEAELNACREQQTPAQEQYEEVIEQLKDSLATIYTAIVSQIVLTEQEFVSSTEPGLAEAIIDDATTADDQSQPSINTELKRILSNALTYYNELFDLTGASNYVKLARSTKDLPSLKQAKKNPYTLSHFLLASDLQKIIGIGPKVAKALKDKKIVTFISLAAKSAAEIKEILTVANPPITNTKMSSILKWIEQAKLLSKGDEGEEQWEQWKIDDLNDGN